MKLNQKGVTLIELIAALALVSIIAAGAWTTLTIGLKHSAVETNKTKIQQDANLIVSSLSAAHRQTEKYNLKIENGYIMLQECPPSDPATCNPYKRIVDRKYKFDGTIVNGILYSELTHTLPEIKIEPEQYHMDLKLQMTSGDDTVPVIINTTLTRILTSKK